ncbi:MAG: SMC-Scp complex subunit ScpB [Candidatus Bathyarchaeota archaeon]|nr:SMC-Scp complex subunit ScpB [Candidatus Bathyarchaeota archaeon]
MSTQSDDYIARLEAILYSSGRPISLATIVAHLKLQDERQARSLVDKLSLLYAEQGSPLEVKNLPEERVVLQLKSDYTREARRFSVKPPLTAGPLRTLSYIAYNQPVEKSAVAEARGSQSYTHIKELEEMGLIEAEKSGRTEMIRTTENFADYLGLSRDRSAMKRQLKAIFKRLEDQLPKKAEPLF